MTFNLFEFLNEDHIRRMHYLEWRLRKYCMYYFSNYFTFETPEFHKRVYKALAAEKNIYFEWFRNSAKTTILQMYVNHCIATRNRRNIMWYWATTDPAEENLTYIANALIGDDEQSKRFVDDYWQLYYEEVSGKYQDKKTKGKNKFITENEIYVRAMGLGTSPRGKNYVASDGKHRPDLVIFDDIDILWKVRTKRTIDKSREFILNEVFWGTSSHTQIVFLGNTIYEDGVSVRLREHVKNDKNWVIIRQPIYDKEWKIVWDRFVETDAEAMEKNDGILNPHRRFISLESERRRLGTISFGQNYLLIPYVRGMVIVQRHLINKLDCKNFYFDKIRIGLDTAISKKQESDRVAFTVTWYDKWKKYVCESVKLEWESKRMPNQIKLAKDLYEKRWKQTDNIMLNVETVAFQEVLADYLKEEKLAVNTIKTHKDKVTRMLEYQWDFEAGNIFFNTTGCDELIEELIAFPNWEYDDMVDSMMMSFNDDHDEWLMESA